MPFVLCLTVNVSATTGFPIISCGGVNKLSLPTGYTKTNAMSCSTSGLSKDYAIYL